MAHLGGIGSDARRAHLALITGGASAAGATTTDATAHAGPSRSGHVARRTPGASFGAPVYGSGRLEAARSQHEQGVRAAAAAHETFEDALLPMVLRSGVSHESATAVREAILGNPTLRKQAEHAYMRARADRS